MGLRKSSMTTMLILLVLLVVTIVTTLTLQPEIREARRQAHKLAAENAALTAENQEVRDDIRALGSDDSAVEIARDRLNYCFEDETVYRDTDQ